MKAMLLERDEMQKYSTKLRKNIDSCYSFCKYECNKYGAVITHD